MSQQKMTPEEAVAELLKSGKIKWAFQFEGFEEEMARMREVLERLKQTKRITRKELQMEITI